jgi:LDH2 family malate/lactate/ureidoglycolate dehydrogenase
VGVPGGEEGDFILDMSPCVAARGKIRKAARRGEAIPEGYALDSQGRSTTDPVAALDGGVVLPMGGPKGSGLAMMMDIFGGVMSGSAFAGDVNDQYKVMDKPQNVGHWFLVFRPEVFLDGGVAEFKQRMDLTGSMSVVRLRRRWSKRDCRVVFLIRGLRFAFCMSLPKMLVWRRG